MSLFEKEFTKLNAESNMSSRLSSPRIFGNKDLRDKIPSDASDADVMRVIRLEAEGAVDRALQFSGQESINLELLRQAYKKLKEPVELLLNFLVSKM